MTELQPHQIAAVERLREALAETDSYDEVPTDDSLMSADDEGCLTQLVDGGGSPFMLGHLRDILSIFTQES